MLIMQRLLGLMARLGALQKHLQSSSWSLRFLIIEHPWFAAFGREAEQNRQKLE